MSMGQILTRSSIIITFVLLLTAALGLASCASASFEAQLYVACKSIKDAEASLRPFRPQMSTDQIETMAVIVDSAGALCSTPVEQLSKPTAALDLLRKQLRELVIMQQAVGAAAPSAGSPR